MDTIGVISDTHRHLLDTALDIFRGDYSRSQVIDTLAYGQETSCNIACRPVDLIIHAGDIGELMPISQDVIDKLEAIAPVKAVLGNRDIEGYATQEGLISEQLLTFEFRQVTFAVMHKPDDLNTAVKALDEQPKVLIHGHTHQARLQRRGRGLLMNPGALHKPKGEWSRRSVGLVHIDGGNVIAAEIVKI